MDREPTEIQASTRSNSLPITENMLQFMTELLHEQMFEWSKTFSPVISVYFGPSLVVVVNDID